MRVDMMDKAQIERIWPVIVELLWPAIGQDPTYNINNLYDRLQQGSALLFEVSEGAYGLWVVSLSEEDGLVAWTEAISGKIDGGPKARLSLIRHAVSALEATLKEAGVKAHRICGRDWSRILPDYAEYADARNGIQKRLI